jgi:hypothetical protein
MVDAESVPGITDRLLYDAPRIVGLPDAKAQTWGGFLVPFPNWSHPEGIILTRAPTYMQVF